MERRHEIEKNEVDEIKDKLIEVVTKMFKHEELDEEAYNAAVSKIKSTDILGMPAEKFVVEINLAMVASFRKTGFKNYDAIKPLYRGLDLR